MMPCAWPVFGGARTCGATLAVQPLRASTQVSTQVKPSGKYICTSLFSIRLCHHPSRVVRKTRGVVLRRASNKETGKPTVPPPKEDIEKLKSKLQNDGLDEETAKKIIEIWSQTGIDDPEKLQKLLMSQSFKSIVFALVQLLLDLGAAYGAYYTGLYWTTSNEFGGLTPVASAVIFLLAGYFFAGAFFDVFTLAVLTFATYQFQTNSTAFLAAVKAIAGTSGLGVVDKATQAANMLKVVDALNKISGALKQDAKNNSTASTLADLSAYLVLENAMAKYGFDPEKYGLTSQQASEIALEFAKFDTNDDGRLELSEIINLARTLNSSLDQEEAKAALKLLDTDSSGYVEFGEFVEWWVNKVSPPP